jgi:hypothetical protein
MARKRERLKKEQAKTEPGPVLNWREKTFSDMGQTKTEEGAIDRAKETQDKEAFRVWYERAIPESQRPGGWAPDEEIAASDRELRDELAKEGQRLEFFNDGPDPLYDDVLLDISILEDSPGHLRLMFMRASTVPKIFGVTWETLRTPPIVTRLKELIRVHRRGGNDAEMGTLQEEMAEIFVVLNRHKRPL